MEIALTRVKTASIPENHFAETFPRLVCRAIKEVRDVYFGLVASVLLLGVLDLCIRRMVVRRTLLGTILPVE